MCEIIEIGSKRENIAAVEAHLPIEVMLEKSKARSKESYAVQKLIQLRNKGVVMLHAVFLISWQFRFLFVQQ
jgi:hypothetical protein